MLINFHHYVLALLLGLISLSVSVSYTDLKYRKIPNKYLMIAMLYALCVFAAMTTALPIKDVAKGFLFSLAGVFIGLLLLLPAYFLKQVAAGDVKFMMVIGFFLGPKGTILALLYGAIVGGIWALVLAWQIGGFNHMIYNLKFMARSAYLTGFKELGWDLRNTDAIKMPYGVALAAGATIVAVYQIYIRLEPLRASVQ